MKKEVVRPARNSLQVREVDGEVISQRDPNGIYSSQRIPIWPIVEALKGKGAAEGLQIREGAHFLGWDMNMENERL
jgi:hypothetical protein